MDDQRTDVPEQELEPRTIEPSYPKNRTQIGGPRLGLVGWLRWAWRQLTSMRTALALLLLLAVAAVPGSIYPQRGVDPTRVRTYLQDHPTTGRWLDRLGMFDVYASPWFASIYILLMISLIGCIIPRLRQHLGALRAQPPRTPARLTRLPVQRHTRLSASPAEVEAAARAVLARHRYRLRDADPADPGAVSGEKGYLKETGNLLFHLALLGVIVAVAVGHLYGWKGEIMLKEGETFTAGAGRYDTLQLGPLVDEEDLPVFSLRLDDLDVQFEDQAQGAQMGQPRVFQGVTTLEKDGEVTQEEIAVNHPLRIGGPSVYLLGNGYAPVVTVRDAKDEILYSDAVTFLPQDNNYSSSGAIKVVGADPAIGLVGGFFPTLQFVQGVGPTSVFPDLVDPALVVSAWEGDLFPDGRPQSVFTIDTEGMTQLADEGAETKGFLIRPGEAVELPGDRGTVELETVIRWAGLSVRHDPGRIPALAASSLVLLGLGLMLGVRRRRLFARVVPGPDGGSELVLAGLPKGTDPGLESLVDEVHEEIVAATGGASVSDRPGLEIPAPDTSAADTPAPDTSATPETPEAPR